MYAGGRLSSSAIASRVCVFASAISSRSVAIDHMPIFGLRAILNLASFAFSPSSSSRDDQPPTFRRPLCWMTVISRAKRFTRRILSAKRAVGDRCRILNTSFRRRLSTIVLLPKVDPGVVLTMACLRSRVHFPLSRKQHRDIDDHHECCQRRAEPKPLRGLGVGIQFVHFPFAFSLRSKPTLIPIPLNWRVL
jgi:hypothetical protein